MLKVRSMLALVMAVVLMGTAPALAQGSPESLEVGPDGWTILTPSQDTRMIYVSSSTGNDNNSGLSEHEPKRTLAAGYAMLRNGHPDWLLLRSGDTWHEAFPFWQRSGRSASERMVVRAYGSGPRPRINTGTTRGIHIDPGSNTQGVRHLVFADMHFSAHTNPGNSSAVGIQLNNSVHNVLIENCYFERYRANLVMHAYSGTLRQSNIAIRRNIIVDAFDTTAAHAQGIYADGVDGLLMEENVLDMNGWSPSTPTANIFRHNVYIQTVTGGDRGCTNVVSRGNISARASATGIMQRPGGVMEDNLFLGNPIGVQFGYMPSPEVSGVIARNVFLDSRDISPTVQRAMGLTLTHANGVTVSENLFAHQRTGTENARAMNIEGTYRNLTIRDNVVYNWRRGDAAQGHSLSFFGTPVSGISILDNDFQQPWGGQVVGHWATVGPAFTYSGNQYHSNSEWAFFNSPSTLNPSQWASVSGENGMSWTSVSYPDPSRDIAGYMAAIGRPATLAAFMNEARQQSRENWRPEFTAARVNAWMQVGFGMDASLCKADLNGDGVINVEDAILFVNLFSTGDPRADINGDGVLNIDDFLAFLALMHQGC